MSASGTRQTTDIHLRDARRDELDRLSQLLEETYREFQAHFTDDLWPAYVGEIADVRSRLGDSELIVAELEGRLVGTVGFYPEASRSALERWPAGWAAIRTLAVLPDARRRGVGGALARECVRRARERNAVAVGLHTNPFMASANRLYERLGFRRAPEFDIEIGEMFTGRRLPPGASWRAQAFRLDLRRTDE
ncbi:MAG TPA: GNAT family N-acetyltransferase [Gaiellaceae bacterium]|nr:GNAT family N-acetyltransferase [Gaiellaceae bacterium]